MSRRALLDRSIGEARGVILADGRPERLLIERVEDAACQRLGAVVAARVRRIERGLGLAFVELPDGPEGVAPAGRLTEGAVVETEVVAEARRGKGPGLRVLGPAVGQPRLMRGPETLEERLRRIADGASLETGSAARQAADAAEDEAQAWLHPLPGGGRIAIEPTQALTAVDVDAGERPGGDPRRLARAVNVAAIAEAARLLRLKGLGGLIVFDLVGKGHDGEAMTKAARSAFEPDEPGVSVGPISRFGLFELSIPRRFTPYADIALDEVHRPTPLTLALRMLRRLETEARADPGGRLAVRCAPEVAAASMPYIDEMKHLIGDRFDLKPEPALESGAYEVARA